MTVAELLAATRAAGIGLRVERGRLLYDAPAGALTPELRQALSQRKPELLAHFHNENPAPLGFAQESLWFLHELYPQDTSASEQFAIRIDGRLDATILAQAWYALLARHAILRTTFRESDGQVCQLPMPPVLNGPLLPEIAVDTMQADLLQIAATALREPFDLHRGPLLKPQLCRIADRQHVLLVTAHHIIADGPSVSVIRTELALLYQALLSGEPSPLSPPKLDYGDIARAQASALTQTSAQHEASVLQRWQEILASPPPAALHALVRPPQGPKISRRAAFRLAAPLADGLRRLARDSGTTPYVVLLAAFRVLLARLTGQHDLVIGTPVTLRDTAELRGLIGCLVNPVALRTSLEMQDSFRSQLSRERAMVLEVLQYRDVPFSRVVAAVSPERKLDEHPLFQILFSWETDTQAESAGGAALAAVREAVPEDLPNAPETHFSLLSLPAERASYFDLECLLRDTGEGRPMDGYFAWSAAVLEDQVARQLPHIYTVLLRAIVARPETPMAGLSLLSETARRKILHDWNDTAAPYPAPTALHDAFLAQTRRVPDAPALRTIAGSFSYAQLEKRSAQLAAELTACGLQAGVPVGLCMPRSADAVIAMLGILRAGGVIVPLDPAWPPARREFVVADAGVQIVLSDLSAVRPDATLKPSAVMPDGAAVLLYTSGSTGVPKGAVTTHASAVNRCHWMWQGYGFGTQDVFALRTSFGFIDSLWEIFGALSHGISLVVVPDDIATDALRLPDFLCAHEVTHLVLVPSLLRALLDAMPAGGLPALRSCISSGEPLDPALAQRFYQACPTARLLNTWGTSEIWDASCHEVRGLPVSAVRVPIGRPVANATVYVLDANAELLPPGIPGELVVGGLGVGPGYWQRPELTAQKFITVQLAPHGQAQRLYRSGDRARWLADGTLECLGRLDAQFKLRGLRIEPGEIESVLLDHPGVAGAIVTICGEGEAARLVAGVVCAAWPGAASYAELWTGLRGHLRTLLPAHMMPTGWHSLDQLPLTPSGKLDRRAFAASCGKVHRVEVPAGAGPRTDTERELAALWSEVLGRQQIGVDENFFDAGGHSLLATRIVSRIRTRYAQDFTLREMFAAPTIAALAAALDSREPAHRAAGLVAVPRDSALPLSFGQERLWFLDQLDPGSPAYNIAWTVRLTGALNRTALRAALDFLIARHEPLRSRFPAVTGRPQQCIDAPESLSLVELDLQAAAEAELQAELTRRARDPFMLSTGPLLRAVLVRRSADEHLLMLAMQHIITDATSNHVLFDELLTSYAAFAAGAEPALPPLAIQYADYALWQRRQHAEARHDAEITWWREQLAGMPTALELPTDYPRPAEQQFHGAWIRRSLPPGLVTALRMLAREQQCTLYMVLLAAFDVLLYRYSGSEDIVVGTPVEGRTEKALERLVGLFINTLVMRTDLGGDPPFTALLQRVRTVTLEAQTHQDLPFEKLVAALRPARSLSRAPLFQLMFNLIRMPEERQQAAGIDFVLDRLVDQGVSSFDLTLTAGEQGEHIGLIFEYATDLYAAHSIEQLADAYTCLLHAIVTSPEQTISRLPLVDEARRRHLLEDFNPPAFAVSFLPVHETITANAGRWPDAPAVSLAGTSLSYAELEGRANRLAHFLLAQDLPAAARIGICLSRELSYLVAVLAVLKAGAAYVPLDSDYPSARLATMADDADLALLLVDAKTRHGFGDDDRLLLQLDSLQAEISRCTASPPMIRVGADDLAYLLYTSGSTGQPKAVMVTHGNIASALAAWLEIYALQPGESHLQMASAAFDVYTGDWVRALGSGGRLVLCPREALLESRALLALLSCENIAVAEFVPAVIRLLLEHVSAQDAQLPPLRLLIVGSDLWFAAEAAALRGRCAPGTRVFNSYGVAEATIDSTCFEVGDDMPAAGPAPIGRPLANARLYVLDAHGEAVPAGVPGELCIGGAGVARGYFGQPELSAEKFLADPFSSLPDARLYRSGDRARWRHDGCLELLGRTDFQFKLRGFRIEPGEVEARLMEHPAIRQAVVGRRETASGDERLVAWLVRDDPALPVSALRLQLQASLPDYLVPSHFVTLPALPLSPNGKIDRSALPEPQWDIGSPGLMPVGGRTSVEEAVCALFAEVLGRTAIGVHDDFFAGGGHSLLATRLVARIRDALQVELPLRVIFTTPTPAGIVAALADIQGSGHLRAADISRYGQRADVRSASMSAPLSAMQQRLWFLDRLQPDSRTWHLPWAVHLRGRLDRQALQVAVDALVARHAVLRTRFVETDGVATQQIVELADLPECGISVEFVALNGSDPQPAVADFLRGLHFDLASGPLWRLRVLEIAPDDQLLVLVMHHIIADGWSLSIMNRELAIAYQAALEGTAPGWSPLPLQYADYARWQTDWLASGGLERQLEFWRDELRGAPALLSLPVDQPRQSGAAVNGAWHHCVLPRRSCAVLHELARTRGCTLFMVLLAAFDVLLGRHAGSEDVLIGTPLAGRPHTGLEGLIGFFINTLVLRTDLRGDPSFSELLMRVRRVTLDAYAHAEVPFEKLVEALAPQRSLRHSPIVQVLLTLHNQPRVPLLLPGVESEPVLITSEAAKFDLSVHVAEEAGGLDIGFAWRSELYSRARIESLAADFLALLEAVGAAPETRISRLLPGVSAALHTVDAAGMRGTEASAAATASDLPAASGSAVPLNDLETQLAEIWQSVLPLACIAPDDDFFAIGGHSLLATRMIARIADRLGVELPLISVFEAPTIRALALRVAVAGQRKPAVPDAIPRLERRAEA